jgi:hypothetical protein
VPDSCRRRPLAKNIWIQTALNIFRFDEIEKLFHQNTALNEYFQQTENHCLCQGHFKGNVQNELTKFLEPSHRHTY